MEEPRLIKIRDRWLEAVPLLKTAYWLKEDFSDILQLCNREKAEELTDLWLIRVEAFVGELCAEYQRGNNKKWDCPFRNVLRTIKTWRPFILNYVDSKNLYSATTSNYFAEHVNQKLKRAKLLCHGISFETVRIKAVHGGVMVARRPPHPLSHKQVRSEPKRRKGQENGNVNPDSNLSRLKKAREDRDETRELLPRFKGLKRK